ncbi:MAG: PHP domain-containing protein [Armatimonadetes bacterium]|nr:PHP domain-containing protein [Armatimonadota bacterium]
MNTTQVYRRPGRADRECKYWWFDAWDRLVNRALGLVGTPIVELSPGEIAMDLHIHTLFSHCSISQPEMLICRAVKLGLGAICIMDHNDIRGALDAIACANDLKRRRLIPKSFIVIPGTEINSSVGHIGALFVTEDLPTSLTPEETVRAIHEAGGLAVAVHPYHSTGICDAVFEAPFDAVEVECASIFDPDLVAKNLALADDPRLASMAKLGASDAHYVNAVGTCYTVLKVAEPTPDALKQAIIANQATPKSSAPCRRLRKLLGGIPKLK